MKNIKIDYQKPIICTPFGLNINEYVPAKNPKEKLIFHLGAMDWKPNLKELVGLLETFAKNSKRNPKR